MFRVAFLVLLLVSCNNEHVKNSLSLDRKTRINLFKSFDHEEFVRDLFLFKEKCGEPKHLKALLKMYRVSTFEGCYTSKVKDTRLHLEIIKENRLKFLYLDNAIVYQVRFTGPKNCKRRMSNWGDCRQRIYMSVFNKESGSYKYSNHITLPELMAYCGYTSQIEKCKKIYKDISFDRLNNRYLNSDKNSSEGKIWRKLINGEKIKRLLR